MDNNNISYASLPVCIIGSGNVASHLAKALEGKAAVRLINPHTLEGIPEPCDIAIIAVKDDAIKEVAHKMKGKSKTLAHTSGSVPVSVLEGCAEHTGVFYPMQTFTKDVALDYAEMPFFIEGDTEESESLLSGLARLISPSVRKADSEDRRKLHLAAVFACNFTNCLVGVADSLLKENGMDYKVMLPLLRQTIRKLESVPPVEAQTGPAARRDRSVIESQCAMLESHGLMKRIYNDITEQIITFSEQK